MSNLSNTTTNPAIPTAAQLEDTRLKQWHQKGEALLTQENLRSWINAAGLVLFLPRPQIASPAPSLVEAVLGAPSPTPTLEQTSEARSLLARMVAEGLAVPLNLLGAVNGVVGETPDFVASTAVFSYVFTLRGDKAWKQPPATSGPVKVSNLALAIHEALSQRGPLTAYDLTTEVGKEVTEAAVLRSLGELWTHLRVLPLSQPDGRPTIWELSSARFTKQIKAGANAGQPSALSALISLYLGQAIVATEDEIESFLSPLASRSRVRDVIHALLAARQLNTLAIEGRTMLHVAGELPAFLAEELPPSIESEAPQVNEIAAEAVSPEGGDATGDSASRITKYIPKPRKIGTGYLAKARPAKFASKPDREGFGSKEFKPRAKTGFSASAKAGFKPRSGAPADSERRPFNRPKPAAAGGFDKPWDEEKAARRSPRTADDAGGARPPRKTFSKPGTFGRKRDEFGSKPAFGGSRPPRRDFGARPERGERPAFGGPRSQDSAGSERPQRSGGFAKKAFGSRPGGGGFEGRPKFSKDRPAGPPREGRGREGQERGAGTESGKRVYRKFDAPRGDRPSRPFSADRPARLEGAAGHAGKPRASFGDRKPSGPGGGKFKSSGSVAKKFSGDFAPRKSAGKPGGGFAGKKPFSKSGSGGFAGKPSSTFAKFADNKKPFGKRPPARKFKPKEDESA